MWKFSKISNLIIIPLLFALIFYVSSKESFAETEQNKIFVTEEKGEIHSVTVDEKNKEINEFNKIWRII